MLEKRIKDGLGAYARLVGLPERRYPKAEELPQEIVLPPELLGNFKDAVSATGTDSKERLQRVVWDRNQQQPKAEPLKVSKTSKLIRPGLRGVFGKKPVVMYHTHPTHDEPDYEGNLSVPDVAYARAYPRAGYIYGMGSEQGDVFLFQTKKAGKPARARQRRILYPFFDYAWNFVRAGKLLKQHPEMASDNAVDIVHEDFLNRWSARKGGEVLYKAGFVAYTATPDQNDPSVNGLKLQRVR